MKTQHISLIHHWPVVGRAVLFGLVLLVATAFLSKAVAQTVNESILTEAYATVAKSSHPESGTANALPPLLVNESGMQLFVSPQINPQEMRLTSNNQTNKKLTFALLDAEKNVLHRSDVSPGWSWKIYNVRELPEGRYTVRLTSATDQITCTFKIEAPAKSRLVF